MGANISTSISEMERELETSLNQSCQVNTGITQKISGNRIVLSGNAQCGNIAFKNTARATSQCTMDSAADVLAKYANKLTEEQSAGLGFNISTDVSKTKEIIKTRLEQSCGANANIVQEVSDNAIEIRDNAQCKMIDFMNTADLTQTCVMKQVAKVTSDILKETEKKQLGFNPIRDMFNFFGENPFAFGSSMYACICCCCMLFIVLGVLGYMKLPSGDAVGEAMNKR